MCGIAGYQGRFAPELLRRWGAAISHRGPDDSGVWQSADGYAGLAHQRLAIIDVSPLGHQPMTDAAGRAAVTFNGEIYNFRDLRHDLTRQGYAFRSQTDTEVLLALYCSDGEAMLSRLNGIFAFAIYDTAHDALFVACDEFAVKPLYFNESARGVVFASELKALVDTGAVTGALDTGTLFRTLAYLWSPGGATPIAGVRRLGPGEALRITGGRISRHWKWSEPRWSVPQVPQSAPEAILQVRDGVRRAVHRQLLADVPLGAFLSGGLDSSAIVAMAREVIPGMDCFTIDTTASCDSGVTDDLPYARHVAAHLGVRLHEVRVDATRMATDLERMVYQLDEPLADPASLNVMYISQLARETGIKVLLSGVGGDDIFSGYRRHRALAMERYWAALPLSIRSGLRRVTSRAGQSLSGRRLTKSFARADASEDRRLTGYFLWADARRLRTLFTAEQRALLAAEDLEAPVMDFLATLPAGLAPLQRMLAIEQRFFLADHNLLYTDKMSMAAGVEVRVPFLDSDLVRLANGLPPEFKQRGRTGKWILKKAMQPFLPREVIHRPKTGFGAPLRQWLRHDLRALVDDTLSAETLRRRGLFDPAAVASLIADDRAGRVDAAYTILALMCVEIWCRRFAGQQPGSAGNRNVALIA
jgi:asparagine synthase (glutamine-hydrolysing)